jgi:GT2 family glycosyltransferase
MISKTIATLITCHNRRNKTVACLKSLFKAEIPVNFAIEIFLVDDGSTDDTTEVVKENFPEVNIIQGDGKLFWSKGMHLAWVTAAKTKKYDFYLWLNDDVVLFPESILELLKTNCSKPDSIVCGSVCSEIDGNITYGGTNELGNLIVPNGNAQKCSYFNGNVVLVPKSTYNIVGNIDPIFPHALGDYDYSLRANKKGVECFISNDYVGFCEKNASLPAWCIPAIPFKKRIKSLYSPLGYSHPYYYFIYENRHFGLITALKHLITIHLRLLFPKLWIK